MLKKCIKCNQLSARYNYPGRESALYCDDCACIFMIIIVENQCRVIGCKEIATHGWSRIITCEHHANEKMILL